MGANQSHCTKRRHRKEGYTGGPSDSNPHPPGKITPRGKPIPPSQPVASDVTHNSVTLSWQPPRHNSGGTVYAYTIEMNVPSDPKTWKVLSKSCQGNSYRAKNLEPGSQHVFRVRAENIHGLSKASRPSEVVETKMFGVDQPNFVPAPEDRARPVPRHQPSINLHLEDTITALLNHTDIQVKTSAREVKSHGDTEEGDGSSSPKSDRVHRSSLEILATRDDVDSHGRRWRSSSLQRDGHTRGSLQSDRLRSNSLQRDANGRSSLQPDRSRIGSLQRDANQRSSLQPSRKRSLPILLPGTKTDSLNKLRDSQSFPVTTTKNRLNDLSENGRRRGQSWRERSASDVDSNASGSREDMVNGKKSETGKGDCKPPKRDSGLEEDSENPWERDDSASEASDGVASAGEDRKGEPCSHSPPDTAGWLGVSPGPEAGQADFRMLRRVLHSDDVIVKPVHSLPDMGGRKVSPHNTLSTIMDLEEEEDSVRITTL